MTRSGWTRTWIALMLALFLLMPLSGPVFAYGGGGGGGGGGGEGGGGAGGGSGGGGRDPAIENQFLPPEARAPDFVYNPKKEENTLENTWGKHVRKKPKHWSDKQWRDYLPKRQGIFRHKMKEAHKDHKSAKRKHQIAKGTGYAAAAGGAVIGAVAAPAAAPTIYVISVVGDGAAATAGSLAEGKSFKESAKDGAKKAVSSAILGKVGSGKTNAAIGFVGGQAYDNASPSKTEVKNRMPPPDGYGMGNQPHWK